jgi:CAAX protease family protein
MSKTRLLRLCEGLVPFIAVVIGLYVFENAWATMLGYHFLAIIVLIIERQGFRRKTLFTGGNLVVVTITFLLAATSGLALYFSARIMNTPNNLGVILERHGLTRGTWPYFILYYSFINPIIEEYYWRGYFGSDKQGITISDICYAGYHPLVFMKFIAWPWAILEFIILISVAFTWRMIIKKYKGLLIPISMHISADITIILAIFFIANQYN